MRIIRKLLFLLCLCGFCTGSPLSLFAQDIGDRLRVSFLEGSVTGTLVSLSSNSLELRLSGDATRLIDFDAIRKLERSLGTRSYWKEGLMYGAGAGVALGLLYGALTHETCEVLSLGSVEEVCDEIGFKTALLAAAGWGGGLGLCGLVVGTLIRRQEWVSIRKPYGAGQLHLRPWVDVSRRDRENPTIFAGASITF